MAKPSQRDCASHNSPRPLARILGPISVACVGIGGAIGSGIFATPGEAARHVHSPWIILGLWALAGLITLLQSMVTAELATRFPRAGGEYQYLKEAYGPFAAFFFGWSFTVFIVGGGAGTIATAFGEFIADMLEVSWRWAPAVFGCGAIISVVVVNAMGLRTGAATQNFLTFLKTALLLAIAVGAMIVAGRWTPMPAPPDPEPAPLSLDGFFLALMPVFWSYTGATDSAKLAEETRDAHRALPRALLASVAVLTIVYIFYNYALLCGAAPVDMAGRRSVPALVYSGVTALPVDKLILAASALICLGAISSVFLANVRVTYALARDGLTFRALGDMSSRQAPVNSIIVGGVLACSFVLNRNFEQILRIYFLASAVLFGMTYASLLVFRRRERSGAAHAAGQDVTAVYRAPAGIAAVLTLIVIEAAIAISIIVSDIQTGSRDSLWTLGLLTGLGALYLVWRTSMKRG